MADTVRTITFLLTNEFQDGQLGTITAQRMRDAIVTLSPPETTLGYSSTINWNLATDPVAKVTLTGNIIVNITSGEIGRSYRLAIIQGGSGNNSVTLTGAVTLGVPTWRTNVGDVNLVNVDIVGSSTYATVV